MEKKLNLRARGDCSHPDAGCVSTEGRLGAGTRVRGVKNGKGDGVEGWVGGPGGWVARKGGSLPVLLLRC